MPAGSVVAAGPLVVLDRSAGADSGQHRHWFALLVAELDPARPLVVVRAGDGPAADDLVHGRSVRFVPVPDRGSRDEWYDAAMPAALAERPGVLLLTSGDDALPAVVRHARDLRRLRVQVRALMFRLSPQPRLGGRAKFGSKMATIAALRVALPQARVYALRAPVGPRPKVDRLLGAGLVVDSSAGEQGAPVGVEEARRRSGLAQVEGPVIVTLGMLGPGKHVDTLVQAWRSAPLAGGRLVFAGEADDETHALLSAAAAELVGIDYRPGRTDDEEFDALLEAADVVCAVYRYSTSSGVALRALAVGSRVLAGGAPALEHALAGVPGVTLVRRPTPARVAEAIRVAVAQPRPVPAVYRRKSGEFPGPLLDGLRAAGAGAVVDGPAAVLVRCRREEVPQTAVILDAEAAFLRAGVPALGAGRPDPLLDTTGRVLGRLSLARPLRTGSTGDRTKIVMLFGPAERQLVPYGLTGPLAWYVWDCWPDAETRWESMFRRWKPRHVFFGARDAADFWRPRLPFADVRWAPEAVEPAAYPPGSDLAERSVVLLEMGRQHPAFHAAAAEHLAARGARHVHSTPQQPFVFPDRAGLVAGLRDAVASVCYPGTMTDPHGRTGTWESMTHRYLEAAAARTLIVGHVPAEMRDLFGFTPGIDVDPASPQAVLDALVDDPAQFQPLVDRTRDRLLEVATWDVRVAEILAALTSPPPAGAAVGPS